MSKHLEPHQVRRFGTVRVRDDATGALAIVLADGRQCVALANEVKSSLYNFEPGKRIICSVLARDDRKLLAFDLMPA